MTVDLLKLRADIVELADREELSPVEEDRWQRLVDEWVALERRIEEGRN